MKKDKPKKRPQELTEREIKELMGQNMQRLKRVKAGRTSVNNREGKQHEQKRD